MEKVKLEIALPESATLKIGEQYIEVIPFLDASTQGALIYKYIEDLFSTDGVSFIDTVEKRRFNAEVAQMMYILQSNTNIDITQLDDSMFFDSQYWHKIIERITNYFYFRELQEKIVEDYEKQIDKLTSTGFVLSGLMEKLSLFVDSLSELTPETLESLQKTGEELIEKLENSKIVEDMERGEE